MAQRQWSESETAFYRVVEGSKRTGLDLRGTYENGASLDFKALGMGLTASNGICVVAWRYDADSLMVYSPDTFARWVRLDTKRVGEIYVPLLMNRLLSAPRMYETMQRWAECREKPEYLDGFTAFEWRAFAGELQAATADETAEVLETLKILDRLITKTYNENPTHPAVENELRATIGRLMAEVGGQPEAVAEVVRTLVAKCELYLAAIPLLRAREGSSEESQEAATSRAKKPSLMVGDY